MSYSRWGDSYWYTYWAVHLDGIPETADNARFEVCGIATFTAAELRTDIDAAILRAVSMCAAPSGVLIPSIPTPEQVEELRGYMLEFVADVDAKYRVACVV